MAAPDLKNLFREVLSGLAGEDGDLGRMEDQLPALIGFASEFGAPDFECLMCGLPPTPPVAYEGPEGIRKAWEDYGGVFESVRAELEEVRESDTHVVALVKQIAVTRTGGVEMSQPSALGFAFENGQIKRAEFHLDRDAALRSAGLG